MATMVDSGHEDQIHDAQLDYYGKRLATCSSDRVVKIFELGPEPGQQTLTANITGHEGPVWQVAWAHPKFGTILATCSYDRKVFVWREAAPGQWTKVYEYADHRSSVNAICFAPHEQGLRLACASADGTLSVLTWRGAADNSWDEKVVPNAHQIGCNAVSWAPAAADVPSVPRLVSGGCDGVVRVWQVLESGAIEADASFDKAFAAAPHSGWVRGVAWAPSGGAQQIIASCGEDKMVHLWCSQAGGPWVVKKLPAFECVVWRVSWSVAGCVLATTAADGKTSLWKEQTDTTWKCIQTVDP
mmetsp:Transcript_28012/g.69300  ORF Transcript_28012/g.69300 Transcript_28012/m.69300 type:complete len:300 (-) Transcript_28012:139-1038(-)